MQLQISLTCLDLLLHSAMKYLLCSTDLNFCFFPSHILFYYQFAFEFEECQFTSQKQHKKSCSGRGDHSSTWISGYVCTFFMFVMDNPGSQSLDI